MANSTQINIASRLRESAECVPHQRAVVFPDGYDRSGRAKYTHLTFRQLDRESDRLARGLCEMGVVPGTRLVLAVPPSVEFIALTFALFKAGAVTVLIDPGMGRTNIFRCLEEVKPQGFIAVPVVHVIRKMLGLAGAFGLRAWGGFRDARYNVTLGRRPFWDGITYEQLLGAEWTPFDIAETVSTDPAAIIFTSGSTGPPKGVLYEHGMFDAQVELLRDFFGIEPGEIDLAAFPLFALFNSGMRVTTVIPDMNPTRPAEVDPRKIVQAIEDHGATQAFGSPALWNRVGRYCEQEGITLPSLRRILSSGAPVPIHVLARMRKALTRPDADMHTPYGATESLPVCSISGREVLDRTAPLSSDGAGTCVGVPFPQIEVQVIAITDGPIEDISKTCELSRGEIGEIIVSGPSTTREYYARPQATSLAKIRDGERFWHRMGDVGYIDEAGALWFCGRKAHIVEAAHGRMFTIPCEAVVNGHQSIYRSALVGLGASGEQMPVIVAEPESGAFPRSRAGQDKLKGELLEIAQANPITQPIKTVLLHPSLPVDIRHNVKIFREKLVPWAVSELAKHS